MKKPYDEELFTTIRDFLTVFLPKQKCCSPLTIKSYRETITLLLEFLKQIKSIPYSNVTFQLFNNSLVTEFLEWIECIRNCSTSTRNQRLAALKSFFKYAGIRNPARIACSMEINNIPSKRVPATIVEFLTENALKTLFQQPDTTKKLNIRDQFFMILMYDLAGRNQKILDLSVGDVTVSPKNPYVRITGKGSKQRLVPLMEKTMKHFQNYLELFHPVEKRRSDDPLFYTIIHGKIHRMSPDNSASFMMRYGKLAKKICSEVPDQVHPHQLRNSRAIHLYRGGMPMPLLAEYLGHVDIKTTSVYAYADTEMKRAAILAATNTNQSSEPELPVWRMENDEEFLKILFGFKS
ncbi:tyrosine-type recombinase/integrase [Paenibacillus sp. FSL M7-0896]|uniref:tyrosine-type recombinase/integrase n=1 Tax=Paenibacillus sp. FSL M7-0896 TaxID=2921610 RepID=UPI0030DA1455